MQDLIPHTAEIALVGTMIVDPTTQAEVFSQIDSAAFGNRLAHTIAKLMQEGKAVTAPVLKDLMPMFFEEGVDVNALYSEAVGFSQIPDLINTIRQFAHRRAIQSASQEMMLRVKDIATDPEAVVQSFISATTAVTTKDLTVRTADEIARAMLQQKDTGRLFTGSRWLDETYYAKGGSRRGQLEYVLAITAHGKTQYLAMLASLYAKGGYSVLWFQFEDSEFSTVRNLQQYAADSAPGWMEKIRITDRCRTVQDLELVLRRYSAESRIDVVVVDYIQAVGSVGKRDIRERVSHVSERLRDLAKDYGCYVIAASQVARDKTRRGYASFPALQDAKESGQIEQDAFVITSIFRPSMVEELRVEQGVRSIENANTIYPASVVYAKNLKNRAQIVQYNAIAYEHVDGLGLRPFDAFTAKFNQPRYSDDPGF